MAQEVEVKVLEVDPKRLTEKMVEIGAEKIAEDRLIVDWFVLPGLGEDKIPWYVRVRTYSSDGRVELSWKDRAKTSDGARIHKEINFHADSAEQARQFFEAIGLACNYHQEKDRIMWEKDNWEFSLDTYPNMPSWLEIEGKSGEHIREAVALLDLEGHESTTEGERVLVLEKYKLNYYDMRF